MMNLGTGGLSAGKLIFCTEHICTMASFGMCRANLSTHDCTAISFLTFRVDFGMLSYSPGNYLRREYKVGLWGDKVTIYHTDWPGK